MTFREIAINYISQLKTQLISRRSYRAWSAKNDVLKISQISQKNTCVGSLFNKVADKGCNFIKKRLQHRSIPEKSTKFLRTPILKNICRRLPLDFIDDPFMIYNSKDDVIEITFSNSLFLLKNKIHSNLLTNSYTCHFENMTSY